MAFWLRDFCKRSIFNLFSFGLHFKVEDTNNSQKDLNFLKNVLVVKSIMLGYIDPGLGGLVVQSVIAGCLTIIYFFRNTIGKVFAGIKRLFKR